MPITNLMVAGFFGILLLCCLIAYKEACDQSGCDKPVRPPRPPWHNGD